MGLFSKSQEERDRKIEERNKQKEYEAKARRQNAALDLRDVSDEVLEKGIDYSMDTALILTSQLEKYNISALLGGSTKESMFAFMQEAQIEQNWILIRQNEQIIRLLKQIASKE